MKHDVKRRCSLWVKISSLLCFAALPAWTLPDTGNLKSPKEESERLDYIFVELNGQRRKVESDEELSFVRGDTLKVSRAYLKDSSKHVGLVSLSSSEDLLEIRERVLDSIKEFTDSAGALDEEGTVYAIVAQTGNVVNGAIFLRRQEPVLSYIDLLVNEKPKVMREGETLLVKETDHFKVVNVVTNIKDNKSITYAVVPLLENGNANTPTQKSYEILFRHKDYVFAKIPLKVESL